VSFCRRRRRSLLKLNGFVVLPCVQGRVRENRSHFETTKGQDSSQTTTNFNSLFPRPKEREDSDRQKSDIVFKINCTQCNFLYYGQTERSLKARIAPGAQKGSGTAPKLQAMSTNSAITWTLQTSGWLESNQITTRD